MAIITEMTQLSPTMEVGTIVSWIKKEGEEISPGDIVAEVETDKAVMEMEAYDSGVLLAIIAPEGSKVAVGMPVAILGEKGEDITDLKKEAEERLKSSSPKKESSKKSQSSSETENSKKDTSTKPIEDASEEVQSESKGDNSSSKEESSDSKKQSSQDRSSDKKLNSTAQKKNQTASPNTGRILASPLAKSIAIQNSVDLKYVKGSGPGGRILQDDVYEYIESSSNQNSGGGFLSSPMQTGEDREIPVSGMRKTIAERLTSSKVNLPHFYLNMEIDAKNLVEFRKRINDTLSKLPQNHISDSNNSSSEETKSPKISINDIIVKAVALSLQRHPHVNASWQGDTIMEYGRVDIGIAVSIDEGLITPVLRNANHLGLIETSQQIGLLADKAKRRKLKQDEFTNSTFTISNLGMFGISFFTAIINEPESAILAVGAIEDKAVVKNGTLVAGKTMQLTLSCDHRVVDGAEGAKFLGTLKSFLENPELLAV
jgi:pyruvate dehydrogenase E2 component (dihydrolipoamide acetyltransferase)